MQAVKVKISSKGQITIPKKFRDEYRTNYLELVKQDDKIFIREAKSVEELAGSLKSYTNKKNTLKEKDAWSEHVKEKYNSP